MKYSENAIKIYEKLYFNRDKNDKLIEKQPIETHERVAKFISFNEQEEKQFTDRWWDSSELTVEHTVGCSQKFKRIFN